MSGPISAIRSPYIRRGLLIFVWPGIAVFAIICGALSGALDAADQVSQVTRTAWRGRRR